MTDATSCSKKNAVLFTMAGVEPRRVRYAMPSRNQRAAHHGCDHHEEVGQRLAMARRCCACTRNT